MLFFFFLQKCDGSYLSSQWYPPSCPLSVQPTPFKRGACLMGFSLNSSKAEELKRALQGDCGSVSQFTPKQKKNNNKKKYKINSASHLANCSRVLAP